MTFRQTKLATALALLLGGIHTNSTADNNISDVANVVIRGNTDNSGNREGVYIFSTAIPSNLNYNGASLSVSSEGNSNARVDISGTTLINGATTINGAGTINGAATVNGGISVRDNAIIGGSVGVTGSLAVTGPATLSNALAVSGNTTLNASLGVLGQTSLAGNLTVSGLSTTAGVVNTGSLVNSGALSQSGVTTINGSTIINGIGQQNTTIGNDANTAGTSAIVSGSSKVTVSQTGTSISGLTNSVNGSSNSIIASGINTLSAATNNVAGTNNNITATEGNNLTGTTNSLVASGRNSLSGATNTITASGENTVSGLANTISASGTNTVLGGSNIIRAAGTNLITGATNNLIGSTNVNVSENYATNINTGTSVQGVTIGNSNNVTQLNSSLNHIGVAEGYATTNRIGTGSSRSSNEIGNANVNSTVTARAGNTTLSLTNNKASLTVPNGVGQANGLGVSEVSSVLTGGASDASRLSLTDSAATFSRASSGAPITVTGVADGRNDFDAVNVRQFASAIAATAAMGNVPPLAAGMDRSMGLGIGNYMGKTGLAFGMNLRSSNVAYRFSVSSGLNEGAKAVVAGGASWSW